MDPSGLMTPPTSQHTSGVDYHATSERIRYEDLSPSVRAVADKALGSPVVRAAPPVTSGFTNAYAGGVLLRDGREGFLKATGPESPFPVLSLRREAQVLEALGDQIPAVAMIGTDASSDGGQVLALDWVEGHLPGLPWTEDEIALVRSACERVAEVPGAALASLSPGQVADDLLEDHGLRAAIKDGLTMPRSPDLLPPWHPARIDEVVALAADTEALRVGDHLIHCDLRPDNLLIGRGAGETSDRAYVLDWNWVTLGPAWCDWVGVIPTMAAQGHDLAKLLDSTSLSRSRTRTPWTCGWPCWRSTCWSAARTNHRRARPWRCAVSPARKSSQRAPSPWSPPRARRRPGSTAAARLKGERPEDRSDRDPVCRAMDDGDRVAGPNLPGGDHAQVGAGHGRTRERPQPAAFGDPAAERATRYSRDGHRQLQLVPDPPPLADHCTVDVKPGRGEVLAEHTAREGALQDGLPVVEILPGIGMHGLRVAAVILAVTDTVAERGHSSHASFDEFSAAPAAAPREGQTLATSGGPPPSVTSPTRETAKWPTPERSSGPGGLSRRTTVRARTALCW